MERKPIPVGYADRPDLVLREKKFRGWAMDSGVKDCR